MNDRANFLALKINGGLDDRTRFRFSELGSSQFFDIDSSFSISTDAAHQVSSPDTRYIFGSEESENDSGIDGGSSVDHIFGGGGDDVIFGFGADDYLEGNAGADDVFGGTGGDELHGNDGQDDLFANDNANSDDGKIDRLLGGAGSDRYYVGDGDLIVDSDRQAHIFVGAAGPNQLTLTNVYKRVADNVYRNEDRNVTIYLQGNNASIVALGFVSPIRIFIEGFQDPIDGFQNGDCGIVLDEASAPPPPGLNPVIGTELDDSIGNNGELAGTAGDDQIEGLGGDDDLFGGTGVTFGSAGFSEAMAAITSTVHQFWTLARLASSRANRATWLTPVMVTTSWSGTRATTNSTVVRGMIFCRVETGQTFSMADRVPTLLRGAPTTMS